MAATDQLNFFVGEKTLILKVKNYSNVLSHSPPYNDFFKVLLKFKMAAMDELHNCLLAQKLKN